MDLILPPSRAGTVAEAYQLSHDQLLQLLINIFVPYQKRDELQVLKDLIELELPAAPGQTNASMLATIPAIDRPKTKQQMSQLAHRSFMAELITLQKDLQRFIDQAQR